MQTVIDEHMREVFAVIVRSKIGLADVLEASYQLTARRGKPVFIRSDNGKEFTAEAL